MAGYLNKVHLIGRIGKDPELHHSNNLRKSASFTLATTESWKDKKTNELTTRTEWHRIVIYNENIIDIVLKYCKQGDLISIEGQLKYREWVDKNLQKHIVAEVVISNFKGEIVLLTNKGQNREISYEKEMSQEPKQKEMELNDEIPF